MSDVLPFGVGAWFFVAIYLCSLLLIGWIGYNARREDTLRDFYLAGGGFGFFVLFLTLYATQYSGNTVFGVAGAAYREGFGWLVAVYYMLAIIVCYLIFAPKLYTLSRHGKYVTPVDFVQERFGSSALSLLASIVMIVALNNYLLAQLMTMGRVLQGFAGPYGDLAYTYGVLGMALIMLIYGTLGGIRAVAVDGCPSGRCVDAGVFSPAGAAVRTVRTAFRGNGNDCGLRELRKGGAARRGHAEAVAQLHPDRWDGWSTLPPRHPTDLRLEVETGVEPEPGRHGIPAVCNRACHLHRGHLCAGIRPGTRRR